MDNLSLFKDFGLDDNMDFFNVSAKKSSKKAAGAEEKKKEAPKKKESSKTDVAVTLPVEVFGRNFYVPFDAENKETCLSKLRECLVEQGGFEELKIPGIGLFYSSETQKVYVVEKDLKAVDRTKQVFESEESQIVVCDGPVKATFTPEDFGNMEYDQVTVNEVTAKWTEINIAYAGCGLAWDNHNVFYPVFADRNVANEKLCHLIVNGERQSFDNSVPPMLAGTYLAEHQKDVPVTLKLRGSGDYLFLSYEKDEGGFYANENPSTKAAAKKKEEEVYKLPFKLHIVTWNMDYELTSDMFDGKEAVTKEQIKKVMADRERMFADNSRKVDMMFSQEHNTMSVMFLSGSKGAIGCQMKEVREEAHTGPVKLIRSLQELESVKKLDYFLGVMCDAVSFKILALPHGNFYGYFGKELECCTIKKVIFERKLPLIPKSILDEIIDYFRRDITKEACVRILYNRTTGEFTVVEAQGKRTKVSIEYDFSAASDLLMIPGMISVMEIHSHNTMDAFFSSVDDEDEQYPGVFGVIGHLDKEQPQMKFRARLDGVSSEPISVTDLFVCC